MCGICGAVYLDKQTVPVNTLESMSRAMRHRGPDGEGVWHQGPVGLGHRRLSIIDLSVNGRQPMGNEDGQVVLAYNGEMYNYQNLRVQLQALGHKFNSRTDSETAIHAYEEWGPACLERFNGMFAIALWDGRNRDVFLARDRFGVKPLYYYYDGSKLLFGSEIKAILAHPGVERKVSLPALNEYFTFQNILTDRTLFEGIKLLPAGHYLKINLDGRLEIRQYWDFDLTQTPIDIGPEEAAEELYRLFVQAVTRQLMSDVPVASYLSGGMDSGSITAVARKHLGRLTTFTCGFDLSSASGLEMGFDERAQSEILSNLLKTEQYEVVLHAGDMEHVMPELIWHLEDLRVGQCYPNYCVARLASKFVKVVLSGAGGDELFAGYPWRYYRGMNSAGAGDFFRNYYNFWQRLVPDDEKSALFVPSVTESLASEEAFDVFKAVFANHRSPLETNEDFVNASLYFELKTFLHGLLLVEDKISMAHSLETRVPFLDNDLVDFACRIPASLKLKSHENGEGRVDENDLSRYQPSNIRTGDGKLILRQAMRRVIPAAVTERVKQGFSAPDASWFRGESIDYINSLLRAKKARIYEYLNPAFVERRLDEHTSGNHNHRLMIWSLLSFEWWLRKFMD